MEVHLHLAVVSKASISFCPLYLDGSAEVLFLLGTEVHLSSYCWPGALLKYVQAEAFSFLPSIPGVLL